MCVCVRLFANGIWLWVNFATKSLHLGCNDSIEKMFNCVPAVILTKLLAGRSEKASDIRESRVMKTVK